MLKPRLPVTRSNPLDGPGIPCLKRNVQVLLEMMDGEKDYGIRNYTIVVKEKNFISNMRTVYREGEDQFPGVDTTMQDSGR